MKIQVLLPVTVVALLCCACSGPVVPAVGESDEVIVVRDGDLDGGAVGTLVEALEAQIDWLLGEKTFRTVLTTPSELGDLRNRRHVLLVGTWDGGEVRDLAKSRLARVRPGGSAALTVDEDVWAKGQVVAAVMAPDAGLLASFVRSSGEEIREQLVSSSKARLMRNLCEDATESGATAMLERRFGWSLCLPSGYDFISTFADSGFVFFRRTRPDRSVFVYWQDGDASLVTSEFIIAMRNQLTARYYDGDEIEWRRPTKIDTAGFAGETATRLSGWWANRELVGGGPFRTYCFYSEAAGKIFLVDVSLFAPGLDKVALFRNLDAVATTFTIAAESS